MNSEIDIRKENKQIIQEVSYMCQICNKWIDIDTINILATLVNRIKNHKWETFNKILKGGIQVSCRVKNFQANGLCTITINKSNNKVYFNRDQIKPIQTKNIVCTFSKGLLDGIFEMYSKNIRIINHMGSMSEAGKYICCIETQIITKKIKCNFCQGLLDGNYEKETMKEIKHEYRSYERKEETESISRNTITKFLEGLLNGTFEKKVMYSKSTTKYHNDEDKIEKVNWDKNINCIYSNGDLIE